MLRPDDPIERIVGRLSEVVSPDGIDLNLACYAPVIRRLSAGSRLFENLPVLERSSDGSAGSWPGLLTVKIRLGSSTLGSEVRFAERLRAHRGLRRRRDHAPLPLLRGQVQAAGEPRGVRLGRLAHPSADHRQRRHPRGRRRARSNPAAFAGVSGLMVGRMAVARPWIFAAWNAPLAPDYHEVWRRLADSIDEDFPPRWRSGGSGSSPTTTPGTSTSATGSTWRSGIRRPSRSPASGRRPSSPMPQPVFDEPSLQGI